MRLIQRPWLHALALCVAAAIALGSAGCKDDEATPEATEGGEAEEADPEEGASEEAESDDEASAEEAESDDEAPEAKAAASPTEAASDKKDKKKKGADAPVARGDKARDRIAEAAKREADAAPREAKASEAAKADKAPDGKAPAEVPAAPADKAEAPKAALQSPAERRKAERERRIAELKRRNEERRKERMDKVDEQRRETEAMAKDVPPSKPAIAAAPKGMSLQKYITQAELRKLVGNDTLVQEGGLSGIQVSDRYNSVYFAPPVRSSFGVSVQVWRDKTRRDANVRFRRMRTQYANAEDTTAPTAKSFVSQWDDILTLSFADLTKRTVVSVSCSTKICKPPVLLALAKAINSKI